MTAIDPNIAELLESETARINSTSFIADDPVQFPRRFTELRDIEIASLIASIMAWGNRKMICRDIDRTLAMTDYHPYDFLREGAYEAINDDLNLHRTFFARHLKWLMRGLNFIYDRYPSLDAFCSAVVAADDPAPAWTLADALRRACCEANSGDDCPRAIPSNMKTTALKRFNMMLRWLVRQDGIVDLGVWKSISPERLYIPMDVHVGNIARELKLIERRANDRKSVEMLTDVLRSLDPRDPCKYDFALFGIGVMSRQAEMRAVLQTEKK